MAAFSLFSSVNRQNYAERLEGESYISIFGHVKVDFTRRPLAPGSYTVSVLALFGNVTLVFPSDVEVRLETVPIFGNATLRDQGPRASSPTQVTLQGLAMFGNLSVRREQWSAGDAPRELTGDAVYERPAEEPLAYEGETQRLRP